MMLGLGRLVRPRNPQAAKLSSYECGEPASGSAWINFNIRFYLVALVFVVFDVELAFMGSPRMVPAGSRRRRRC